MVDGLTQRQKQLIDAISEAIQVNGRPPSIPELMLALGVSSPNGIAKHLNALEAKGYIARDKGARGIRLLSSARNECDTKPEAISYSDPNLSYVPLLGTIAAGAPILAEENVEEMIPVPQSMTGSGETFFLRVKGDSMIEEGILSGDLVMVSKCDSVSNGELAAIMVEDEATVKRFYNNGSHIMLEPANQHYEPIIIPAGTAQCAVIGRIVGLIRSYKTKL